MKTPSNFSFPRVEPSFDLEALIGYDVTFVNPFSWLEIISKMEEKERDRFKIFADGIGVVWFYNFFLNAKLSRFSFDYTSVAPQVFDYASKRNYKVFLIGGKKGVAESAASHFITDHSNLIIAGTESGYFHNEEHRREILQKALLANFVIVGMGTPYQEQFLLDLRSLGWSGTGFTCGGFFDQTSEKGKSYYPKIVDLMNLRWLFRLLTNPRRLGRRYLIIYPKFVFTFLMFYFKKRVTT